MLAIGEAKWGEVMDIGHLERLRQIKDLIATAGRYDASRARLMCLSGVGFSEGLQEAAAADDGVLLAGADELYGFKRYRSA